MKFWRWLGRLFVAILKGLVIFGEFAELLIRKKLV